MRDITDVELLSCSKHIPIRQVNMLGGILDYTAEKLTNIKETYKGLGDLTFIYQLLKDWREHHGMMQKEDFIMMLQIAGFNKSVKE